jgi:dolichol-phosphate mannosyltransferase
LSTNPTSPDSSLADRGVSEEIYALRFPADAAHVQWRRDLWSVLHEGFFSRWIPSESTVLDFGCGTGELISAVRATRRIAADLRPSVANGLPADVEFVRTDGVHLPGVADGSIDVVFCSNVLEHMRDRDELTALLIEFRRVLRRTGRLLVMGPNLRFTGPAYWDFFDHRIPLTDRSLVEAFASADLVAETVIPRFLPYTTVGRRPVPLALVRLYLRLPFVWRLFGAQFFAIARPGPSRASADPR